MVGRESWRSHQAPPLPSLERRRFSPSHKWRGRRSHPTHAVCVGHGGESHSGGLAQCYRAIPRCKKSPLGFTLCGTRRVCEEKHWVIGTIFMLSGTERVEAVLRADLPGLSPAGWSGTNSAKCKGTTNEEWRVVGPRCLSPASGKRQRGQICEATLLL